MDMQQQQQASTSLANRLKVAEQAVKIVKKYNSIWQDDKQRGMVNLCTEIAGILDTKTTLESLVESQRTEIDELRRQISSVNTASSSGRGTAEPNQDLLSESRPLSCSVESASSGHGTSFCDQGTDPFYTWPVKVTTCTRSTSPALVSSPHSMSSPLGSTEDVADGGGSEQMEENESNDRDNEESVLENGKDNVDDNQENDDETANDEKEDLHSEPSDEARESSDNKIRNDKKDSRVTTTGKKKMKESKLSVRSEGRRQNQRGKEPAHKRTAGMNSAGSKITLRISKTKNYKTMWKTSDLNLFEENTSANKRKTNTKRGKSPVNKDDQRNGCREVPEQYLSESSSSSGESEEEEEIRRKVQPELTSEYWDIHKLIRYLKIGNPTATVIVLCALRDLNLEQESCQVAIEQQGGLDVLLNILKTGHERCVIGALRILKQITNNRRINMEIYRLGGIQQFIHCLDSESTEIQSLAAEIISRVVVFRKACSEVRCSGGLKKLVNLLRSVNLKSKKSTIQNDGDRLARNACMALWSSSKGTKNIKAIRVAGAVPILGSLLATGKDDVILPTVGILQECASEPAFREDMRKEGMIAGIIRLLKKGDQELKTLCACALFKCATDKASRELINRHGGLDPLAMLLRTKPYTENKELLSATVGAVWQCALNEANVKKFEQLSVLQTLILLLKNDQPNEVVTNLLGAMREFAYSRRNILVLYEERVIAILVKLLNLTDSCVLINSTRLLEVCATEPYSRGVIFSSDGLRLLWSLFKSQDPKVVASAADAVTACVVDTEESAEIVRSFVGGLELITTLLKSDSREVLISATRAIIRIGQDIENMSIMTDYDVVPMLTKLCFTTAEDEELRQYVAEAIATGCRLEKNILAFSPTVVPLADGLNTFKNEAVCKATTRALERLSCDPENCRLIHKHGSLKYLLSMTGSSDEGLQVAAAGCIRNLRMNALSILER